MVDIDKMHRHERERRVFRVRRETGKGGYDGVDERGN